MIYFRKILKDRDELSVRYDVELKAIWIYLRPKNRSVLTLSMIKSGYEVQNAIIDYFKNSSVIDKYPIRYLIIASHSDGVFSFGGDLKHFLSLIKYRKRDELLEYTKLSVDNLYLYKTNLSLPIQTISFLQGNAFGGGFELALSCSYIVANESIKLGFPESRFNLYPGIGGYTFLSNALGMNLADRIIREGKIYTAQQMYQWGLVSALAKDGDELNELKRFIKNLDRSCHTVNLLSRAKKIANPISYDELYLIAKEWANMIYSLSDKEIRTLERLVNSQKNRQSNRLLRAYQDRRILKEKVNIDRRVKDRRSA